jgi:hypothetical protein
MCHPSQTPSSEYLISGESVNCEALHQVTFSLLKFFLSLGTTTTESSGIIKNLHYLSSYSETREVGTWQ